MGSEQDGQSGHGGERWSPGAIERQLSGQLICIRCGYDLRGLSITGACPECALPIKATLLAAVDPQAEEIAPLDRPRLTGYGLQAWTIGALLACLLVWADRLIELTGAAPGGWAGLLLPLAIGGLCVSMLGAMTLIRPRGGLSRALMVRAVLGVLCYGPLMLCLVRLDAYGAGIGAFIGDAGQGGVVRTMWRIGANLSIAGVILGLRPSGYRLALRSVVVREGRVDRQHLYALIAALGAATVGDLAVLSGLATQSDWLRSGVLVLVALGSVLFTLGLAMSVRDTTRLLPVIAGRPVGLGDVFESNAQRAARRGGVG